MGKRKASVTSQNDAETQSAFFANLQKQLAPMIAAAAAEAVSKLTPGLHAVVTNIADAYAKANPQYFPGTAQKSSTPFNGSVNTMVPIPQADESARNALGHVCSETGEWKEHIPEDLPTAISYIRAVNAKLDALVEATGHGSSAAMADHS